MSSHNTTIVITAIGAVTPVGSNAEQTCAAIQAGMSRFTEHAYFRCTPEDPEWDEDLPLFASDVPLIDPFVDGPERLLQLALPALTELMGKTKLKRVDLEQSGLMLALPQADKAINPMNLATDFIPELCKRTGLTTFKLWKSTQAGHTGVFSLLKSAIQKLQANDVDYCILGGVESYLLENRLDILDTEWRIRSERTVDGFIPGEAAVMLMLETAEHARERGMPILAHLDGLGEGIETETILSDKHSTGAGLTQAIESAFELSSASQDTSSVYCSLNGESYYAFDWGVALGRLQDSLKSMKKLIHPADCIGDTGAATGALLLACAASDLNSDNAVGTSSLLWTASDNGHRMALTLNKVLE